MANVMDAVSQYQIYIKVGGAVACTILTATLIKKWMSSKRAAKLRSEWDSVGRDVVVLHQLSPCYTAPSLSPFPVKLETYLRMADIKYVNDNKSPMSPKGKTPWITINGEDISDSQLSLEYLAKKFGKYFGNHLTTKEKAIVRAFRVMVEEHVYWGLAIDRWVHEEGKHLSNYIMFGSLPKLMRNYIVKKFSKAVKQAAFYQGLGRHSKEEIQGMVIKDLEAISVFLGNKPFFTGIHPCEVDCTMFGFICQILACSPPECVYTIAIKKDFPNLIAYYERMKEKFWPDWNNCLAKTKQ